MHDFYNSLNYVALSTVALGSVFSMANRYWRVKQKFGLWDSMGFRSAMATIIVTILILGPLSIRFATLGGLETIELFIKFAWYIVAALAASFIVSVLGFRGIGDGFENNASIGTYLFWTFYALVAQLILVAPVLILNLLGDPENYSQTGSCATGPNLGDSCTQPTAVADCTGANPCATGGRDNWMWLYIGLSLLYPIGHGLVLWIVARNTDKPYSRLEQGSGALRGSTAAGQIVQKTGVWLLLLIMIMAVPAILQMYGTRSTSADGASSAPFFVARWRPHHGHCRITASGVWTAQECTVFDGAPTYGCGGGEECGFASAYGFVRWPLWMQMIAVGVPTLTVFVLYIVYRARPDSILNATRRFLFKGEAERALEGSRKAF